MFSITSSCLTLLENISYLLMVNPYGKSRSMGAYL